MSWRLLLAVLAGVALGVAPGTAKAACTGIGATTLTFGNYYGMQLTSSAGTVTLYCSASFPYQVGLNAGTTAGASVSTRKMASGANRLNYALFQDAAHTTNWGNSSGVDTRPGVSNPTAFSPTVLTVYAVLAASQYPTPGFYSDTITATVLSSGSVNTTFQVNVTVQAACTISATPLAFGIYSGAQLDVNATITATCTNSTPYSVGLSAGNGSGATVASRKMTGPGGAAQGYGLFRDSARTLNWGNTVSTDTVAGTGTGYAQQITVYGRVAAGQSLAKPGTYEDVIVATLSY